MRRLWWRVANRQRLWIALWQRPAKFGKLIVDGVEVARRSSSGIGKNADAVETIAHRVIAMPMKPSPMAKMLMVTAAPGKSPCGWPLSGKA